MPKLASLTLAEMQDAFARAAQAETPMTTEQFTEEPGTDVPAEQQSPKGLLQGPIPMIIMLGFLFWFIVMRPQKKDRDQRKQMLETMSKGDKVVSVGGIHGKIVKINDNDKTIDVEVSPKQVMTFSRAAIQTIVNKKAATEEAEKKGISEQKD